MRSSRGLKRLLLLLGLVLVAGVYYYIGHASTGLLFSYRDASRVQAASNASLSSTTPTAALRPNNRSAVEVKVQAKRYNVWCIFTKVTSNSPMRRKFKVFINSLLRYSSEPVALHVITDEESQGIAEKVIEYISLVNKKSVKVQYYNVHKSAKELEDIVAVMSPRFSSKPGTYYSDALFFLSLGLHKIASEDQDLAVMIDADTKFRKDIKELFKEFDNFGDKALFGLAPELTPVYRHVLYIYRNKNPKTIFGEPGYLGGFPGYNSGIVLFHLKRLRESLEWDQIVSRDSVEHLVEKYEFKGHLGDQDFYTLLGMERPELIHTIDCGWNRQLCTWWRDRGYADVFANYSRCNSETKLWHGNCNTPIPDSGKK